MVSNKQLIANRGNAKLGGVKTEEGKAITRFNALAHGILRQTITVYEKDFYLEIYTDLVKQYEPATIFEKILIERITVYYLKLYRVQRAEQEYMKSILDPREVRMGGGMLSLDDLGIRDEIINQGYVPQIRDENIQKLADIYSRYEITLENRMLRMFHELERAIAVRKGQQVPTPTLNIFQMGSFRENTQSS